jgi:hypothetical protein
MYCTRVRPVDHTLPPLIARYGDITTLRWHNINAPQTAIIIILIIQAVNCVGRQPFPYNRPSKAEYDRWTTPYPHILRDVCRCPAIRHFQASTEVTRLAWRRRRHNNLNYSRAINCVGCVLQVSVSNYVTVGVLVDHIEERIPTLRAVSSSHPPLRIVWPCYKF